VAHGRKQATAEQTRIDCVSAVKPSLKRKPRENRASLPLSREHVARYVGTSARVFLNGWNEARGIQLPPTREGTARETFREGVAPIGRKTRKQRRSR
jgi:hypothetical protein